MRFVSFDPLRTLGMPSVRPIRPESWLQEREAILRARWVLFPETWQVNALVYGWRKRIFPSLPSYHLGYSKIEMTRAFEAVAPAHVPATRILPATEASVARVLDELRLPIVVKEVRSSMGRGVALVRDRAELAAWAAGQPVLYAQEYLPIRRDLRIVIVGRGALAAYWRIAADACFHNNVARGASISFDGVPEEVVRLVEGVAGSLGIDHAGFDVAVVDGHPYLLEFNLLFGTSALAERGIRSGPRILEYLTGFTQRPRRPQPGRRRRRAG